MVRVWAEKEMRNLKRLRTAGIRCPEPVEVRENVLVMTFVGDKDGWASPRLKDADIPEAVFPDLYVELMLMTRKIFTECKLVHADLSEYNILYHIDDTPPGQCSDTPGEADEPATEEQPPSSPRGHLHIIDVSQSVEQDHPHAFDFLRSDLHNIEDFFSKRGVRTVGLRRAFEFVTRERLDPDDTDKDEEKEATVLREWMDTPEAADGEAKASDDAVFMRSYIPRTLNEVFDPERDVGVLSRGEGANLIYKDTIGIVGPKEGRKAEAEVEGGDDRRGAAKAAPAIAKPRVLGDGTPKKAVTFAGSDVEEGSEEDGEAEEGSVGEGDDGSECEGSGEAEDDDAGAEGFKDKKPRGHRHEDKEEKKQRKKAAKEEAREKRKHKIPKAEKKRRVKATARGG
ncbi:hypothetical protein GSI_15203 [Ganoderma sinense ZZ0214-1]|uniref:non-specific serine/threonine protein kinase n=1 Tax=Ganoderma sinense ZZ0214-1 TaxID=1077348 RepID=A0A2G8RLX2_9APHY|nr:hypothetical protein GSI_15203 [Ganoderma sinense ZZ0214-1]